MSHQNNSERAQSRMRFKQIASWLGTLAATIVLLAVAISGAERLREPQIAEIQTYDNLTPEHGSGPIAYPQSPPVGGPHDPVWQNCGTYEQPIRSENAVHSLEHGAVWIAYQPNLPAEAVARLKELARERSYILLAPYPDLPTPIVATAWGAQLRLDGPENEQLLEFIAQYLQGPQSPEPGAVCTGGVGTPL